MGPLKRESASKLFADGWPDGMGWDGMAKSEVDEARPRLERKGQPNQPLPPSSKSKRG